MVFDHFNPFKNSKKITKDLNSYFSKKKAFFLFELKYIISGIRKIFTSKVKNESTVLYI